jgi:hypothetical protein
MKSLLLFITYEGLNLDNSLDNPVAQAEIVKFSERLSNFADTILSSETGFIDIKSNGSIEVDGFTTDLQNSIIDYLKTSKGGHYN